MEKLNAKVLFVICTWPKSNINRLNMFLRHFFTQGFTENDWLQALMVCDCNDSENPECLQTFKNKVPNGIVIKHKNSISGSRNVGIDFGKSHGFTYIMFFDDDDLYTSYDKFLEHLDNNHDVFIFESSQGFMMRSSVSKIYRLDTLKKYFPEGLVRENAIWNPLIANVCKTIKFIKGKFMIYIPSNQWSFCDDYFAKVVKYNKENTKDFSKRDWLFFYAENMLQIFIRDKTNDIKQTCLLLVAQYQQPSELCQLKDFTQYQQELLKYESREFQKTLPDELFLNEFLKAVHEYTKDVLYNGKKLIWMPN